MTEINKLYRRMRNLPIYTKDNGAVTSALFLDSKGVSVDYDNNRPMDSIIKDEERLHNFYHSQLPEEKKSNGEHELKAIVSVDKSLCDEKEIYIEMEPVENVNPFHSVLKKSKDITVLSTGQRKYLATHACKVKEY